MDILFNIYNNKIVSTQIKGNIENFSKIDICLRSVVEAFKHERHLSAIKFYMQFDVDTCLFFNVLSKERQGHLHFYDTGFTDNLISLDSVELFLISK